MLRRSARTRATRDTRSEPPPTDQQRGRRRLVRQASWRHRPPAHTKANPAVSVRLEPDTARAEGTGSPAGASRRQAPATPHGCLARHRSRTFCDPGETEVGRCLARDRGWHLWTCLGCGTARLPGTDHRHLQRELERHLRLHPVARSGDRIAPGRFSPYSALAAAIPHRATEPSRSGTPLADGRRAHVGA